MLIEADLRKWTLFPHKPTCYILDTAFEQGDTEAPWMVRVNGTYVLFYSASDTSLSTYCVSVAKSSNLLVKSRLFVQWVL